MADAADLVDNIEYQLKDWIPKGMLTALIAEPGMGKSALTLGGVVRPVTTGADWFDGSKGPAEPGKVLWCGTKNDVAITIHRMRKWKIPMDRVLLPFADDPLATINLGDQSHLDRIEAIVVQCGVAVVVVDSLRGGHDGDENCSSVGKFLKGLAAIAERTGVAVVVVHHTKKMVEGEEVTANSSRGSNAIVALFRSQIGIDRPDPKSKVCRVRVLKENLGLAPAPVGFEVMDAGLRFGPAPEKPRNSTEKDRAAEFLRAAMKPGVWYEAAGLTEDARQQGISEGALHRAKADLGSAKPDGLKKVKDGWSWRLPPPVNECPNCGHHSFHTLPHKPPYKDRAECWKCDLRGDEADILWFAMPSSVGPQRAAMLEGYRAEYDALPEADRRPRPPFARTARSPARPVAAGPRLPAFFPRGTGNNGTGRPPSGPPSGTSAGWPPGTSAPHRGGRPTALREPASWSGPPRSQRSTASRSTNWSWRRPS